MIIIILCFNIVDTPAVSQLSVIYSQTCWYGILKTIAKSYYCGCRELHKDKA